MSKSSKYQDIQSKKSLLCRQYRTFVPALVAIYAVLQAFVGIEHAANPHPVCNDKHELKSWVWLTNFAMVCCFALNFLLTLNRMWVTRGQHSAELFCSLAANLGINIIAGSANLITYIWDYGGLCRDSFG